MELLRCPNCGGEMELISNDHYKCKFCKKEFIIKTDNSNSQLVFSLNTAAMYRAKKDFDSAMEEYERAIEIDGTCSVAYWGMFLSEYGIEFVEDPQTKEYKPTLCHRIQSIPVIENANFKNAIKYASPKEKTSLLRLSKQIDVIREQLLQMSGEVSTYDIFICYKQNEDATKAPTEESSWARDIYYQLLGFGYKVFYAEQSLADKEGSYEANIYSALNSAKVMLILATSVDHITATWVKNEWSRYTKLVKEDPSKSFKVIMSGFEPENLPVALRSQQVIRKDAIDWWDKTRTYLENVFAKNNENHNISEESKKRLADFNNLRTKAIKERNGVKLPQTAAEILRNKQKEDKIKQIESVLKKGVFNNEKFTELKNDIREFCANDFEAARYFLLLESSIKLNKIILEESELRDFALSSNELEGFDFVLKLCNRADECKFYESIKEWCNDNVAAEEELKPIFQMLSENMFSEALQFAQEAVQKHPYYQYCWLVLLMARTSCPNMMQLINRYGFNITKTNEYKNMVGSLANKDNCILTKPIKNSICGIKETYVSQKEKEEAKLVEAKRDKTWVENRKDGNCRDAKIMAILLILSMITIAIVPVCYLKFLASATYGFMIGAIVCFVISIIINTIHRYIREGGFNFYLLVYGFWTSIPIIHLISYIIDFARIKRVIDEENESIDELNKKMNHCKKVIADRKKLIAEQDRQLDVVVNYKI